MILFQVSLYPLQQEDINEALGIFWRKLEESNVHFRVTPMSTLIWGEDEESLYDLIFKAYRSARQKGPLVMINTLTSGENKRMEELLGYLNPV